MTGVSFSSPISSGLGLRAALSSSTSSSVGVAAAMASAATTSTLLPPPTPDSAGSLRALEGLLTEFFAPRTTNERKREIEALLNDFGGQKDSWKQGFYFLTNTDNEYVMMYSMSVIENVINKRWQGKGFIRCVIDCLRARETVRV